MCHSSRSSSSRPVILDYLMLNADRGLESFVTKCRDVDHEVDTPLTSLP